jgi:hypothetical protein
MPTIMLMDKATVPELKYSPKRSVIILGVLFLLLFLLVPFVFWGENAVNRGKYQNPLQIKEANFFNRILKIYRMKF